MLYYIVILIHFNLQNYFVVHSNKIYNYFNYKTATIYKTSNNAPMDGPGCGASLALGTSCGQSSNSML